MKIRVQSAAAALGVFALLGITASPALALSQPEQPTLESIVPQVMAETAPGVDLDYQDVAVDGTSSVDVTRSLAEFAPGAGTEGDRDALTVTVLGATIEDDASTVASLAGEAGVTTHVQPTDTGVRFLTEIDESATQREFSYLFDLPADTVMEPQLHSDDYWLWSGNQYLGTLRAPWALDASGAEVPTSYSWADGVLTQSVDLSSSSVEYPVVADPAWTYQHVALINGMDTNQESTRKLVEMKSCFNCVFPIDGAPAAYPSQAYQLLPLHWSAPWISPLTAYVNFHCLWNGDWNSYHSAGHYWGFMFTAAPGHIEGVGSSIEFNIGPRAHGGQRYLTVDAWVMNDFGGSDQAKYAVKTSAGFQWNRFAERLATP